MERGPEASLLKLGHLPGVRTVAPFAAHYLAQIELSPLAEYNQAHLQLMSGTDRLAAMPEMLAALVCVVGVSELARLLLASWWGQMVAAVICAAIPTGILLATSAENDYVAAATGLVLVLVAAAFTFGGRWLIRSLIVGRPLASPTWPRPISRSWSDRRRRHC